MADRAIDKIRLALTHEVPEDCYSTGPNLGTAQDYVCVACEALRALAALALPAEPRGDEEDLRDVIEYDRDKLWCDVLFNAEAGELGPKVHTTPEGGKRIMENIISCRVSAGASATPAPSEPLYEILRQGKDLVESTLAHVSHGGPTREEAEKWLAKAKEALQEPDTKS